MFSWDVRKNRFAVDVRKNRCPDEAGSVAVVHRYPASSLHALWRSRTRRHKLATSSNVADVSLQYVSLPLQASKTIMHC